jgi:hypothetical protein
VVGVGGLLLKVAMTLKLNEHQNWPPFLDIEQGTLFW